MVHSRPLLRIRQKNSSRDERSRVDSVISNPYSGRPRELGNGREDMTKAELIERVYAGKNLPRGLTKKAVAQIVDAVFTEMGDYFIRTRVTRNQAARLTYPGFGT